MQINRLTPQYHVAPQIDPADAAAIKEAGYTLVICNRPDAENPEDMQADAMGEAMRAQGLDFKVLPITHQSMTDANIALQMEMVDAAEGPVLAYCASGTRCTVLWALAKAGTLPVAEIVNTAAEAGYDLRHLSGVLEQRAGA